MSVRTGATAAWAVPGAATAVATAAAPAAWKRRRRLRGEDGIECSYLEYVHGHIDTNIFIDNTRVNLSLPGFVVVIDK
nr:hypothetical protein GCM10025732_35950 [Glycomyces mayteni]